MASDNTILTIRSIENRHHAEPHECEIVGTRERAGAPTMLIVSLHPPLPGHAYGTPSDISRLYLSPRHVGVTLLPEISEWPCHVHMCVPGTSEDHFEVLDWGVLEKKRCDT